MGQIVVEGSGAYPSREVRATNWCSGRRLGKVNAPESSHALPLAQLLEHTAKAVQAVRAGASLTDALDRCPQPARAGTQALSFHVLRWLGSALVLRERLAPRTPAPAQDALLLTVLALLWPPSSPPYAAHTVVDQAVQCARSRKGGGPGFAGFVNAVARRFLRDPETLVEWVQRAPLGRLNHPEWWVDRLRDDWPDRAEAMLIANNRHPPMTLRVNARWGDAARYLGQLQGAGMQGVTRGEYAVTLASPCSVDRLPGFAQGWVSVQDLAAQHAAEMLLGLGLAPGARVLDACAAPGGKTAHLLEHAELQLLALDSDSRRLARVEHALTRLGLSARMQTADARAPETWWDGQLFDAVLLDAPCSGSGVVRRHPDIRWLRRSTDIATLARVQAELLDALWPLVRPGGHLLYCTCSVFKAEGSDQTDAFLQRHAGAHLLGDSPALGHFVTLPDNPDAPIDDGFFYALLEKSLST